MNDKQKEMVLDWMRKIHQLEYAHRYESLRWSSVEKWLGISAFIISTLIAATYRFPKIESELFNSLPFFLKQDFLIPVLSTIVAILTGLLAFLRPSEKSETHKKTGSNYEKLRHRIEFILTSKNTENELVEKLENIREEWENLDSINVSNKYFIKGKDKVNSFGKYGEELRFLENVSSKTENEKGDNLS